MAKNVLFIDDEPTRVVELWSYLDRQDYRIYLAHGFSQIHYYLRQSRVPFQIVCIDHDMPMMDGMSVLREFGLDLPERVLIHSHNPSGAERMADYLHDLEEQPDWKLIPYKPEAVAAWIRGTSPKTR